MFDVLLVALSLTLLLAMTWDSTRVHAYSAIFAVSTLLTHRVLLSAGPSEQLHVGIATAHPAVTLAGVSVVILGVAGLLHGPSKLGAPLVLPLLTYLVLGAAFYWNGTSQVHAGLWHLTVASLGIVAGGHLARSTDTWPRYRLLCGWIALIMTFQTVVAALQLAGLHVFYNPELLISDPTLAGRATGTFFHPGTLGKMSMLVTMVTLPLLAARSRPDRFLGWFIVAACAASTAATLGRANAAALVSLILLWVLFSSTRAVGWSSRLRVGIAIAIGGLVTSPLWAERFANSGTSRRSYLASVALQYLDQHSWFVGSGPNTYVETVGQTDALTASGWPVHNLFLLVTVELGLVGALLLALILFGPATQSWRLRRKGGLAGSYALVLVASTPGFLVIVLTGWGMLADPLAPWTMTIGYCWWKARYSALTDSQESSARQTPAALTFSPSTKADAPANVARQERLAR